MVWSIYYQDIVSGTFRSLRQRPPVAPATGGLLHPPNGWAPSDDRPVRAVKCSLAQRLGPFREPAVSGSDKASPPTSLLGPFREPAASW